MKHVAIIGFLIAFSIIAHAQNVGYSDKIEEAILNCNECNVCADGKTIEEGKICVYFFWGQGCPHCAEEKPFLEELKKKYPIEVYDFEVYFHEENLNLWRKICEKNNLQASGVPMTFIGSRAFIGFSKKNSSYLNIIPITVLVVFIIIGILFLISKKVRIKVKV
ncbi:MAG: thioredoxin family protein [Candidatus Aenigmatarchaeota archaeon]